MFSEVRGQLSNSETTFSAKVNDSFGNAIVKDIYDPFKNDLQKLDLVWNEAEIKKMEIMALFVELRTIL